MRTATLLFLLSIVCLSQQDAPPAGAPGGPGGGRNADPMSSPTFNALRFRALGPASASGRVTSIAVDPRNPAHYFIGVASGGVWRTNNNGISWTPVFDNEGSYSIGTVALDPKNPSTV
ncbi:MAG TPA: glycosyl hydrolase, partial [Bryobacteraceae bacterium]|nr:glycosyl hydrolase [Bryobacteraceae bacterium]